MQVAMREGSFVTSAGVHRKSGTTMPAMGIGEAYRRLRQADGPTKVGARPEG
jgi:hypothetical protein